MIDRKWSEYERLDLVRLSGGGLPSGVLTARPNITYQLKYKFISIDHE